MATSHRNSFSVLDPQKKKDKHLLEFDEVDSNDEADVTSDEETSQSEASETEGRSPTEHVSRKVNFFSEDEKLVCIFCDQEWNQKQMQVMLDHLLKEHSFVIADIQTVAHVPSYLDFWKDKFKHSAIQEYTTTINTQQVQDGKPRSFYMLSDILPEDKKLRFQLQQKRLNYVLELQQKERAETFFKRKCLFCKQWFDERKPLFHHMYRQHNFNIGLPDNIVNSNGMLDIFENKLRGCVCLYCEKVFKSPAVLKVHMRKKRHYKINPKNKDYDRFYLINYLEEGRTWEDIMSDNEDDSDVDADKNQADNWDDWQEDSMMDSQIMTPCLYCETPLNSADAALAHAKAEHGFDLVQLKKDFKLDFYSSIKLINYIRAKVMNNACVNCDSKFENNIQLVEHLKKNDHFIPGRNLPFWRDSQYLLSTLHNDPLLCCFEPDSDDDGPIFDDEPDNENNDDRDTSSIIQVEDFDFEPCAELQELALEEQKHKHSNVKANHK